MPAWNNCVFLSGRFLGLPPPPTAFMGWRDRGRHQRTSTRWTHVWLVDV